MKILIAIQLRESWIKNDNEDKNEKTKTMMKGESDRQAVVPAPDRCISNSKIPAGSIVDTKPAAVCRTK